MTQSIYYGGLLGLSILLTFLYVLRWQKNFDVHLSAIFILIPIANLTYYLMYTIHDPETVTAVLKIIYIGGCYLPWLATMCVLSLCQIKINRFFRVFSFLASTAVYLSVLGIGHSTLFYRSLIIKQAGDAWVAQKEYGPFHLLHYIVIIFYLTVDLAAILYSYRKQKQVSRMILFLLFIPIPLTVAGYMAGRFFPYIGYELTPFTYVLAQIVYLLIASRMALYNVSEMVIDSMVQSGDTGFITVDSGGRYLGSNETAKRILPGLNLLTVDQPIRDAAALQETVISWLERFQNDPEDGKMLYTRAGTDQSEEKIFSIMVSYLYDGKKRCGYQIFLEDDTSDQKYIRLMDRYNADLQEDVAAKTERIVVMHNKLILGMAAMVESRDNSTGGHIRRTSEGVRILIEAIREDGSMQLSDEFCRDIIKAAPMHDLGKIAVDDAVLRKPGRFTQEEFEKMKSHAAEGAHIVHEILRGTDDEEFRRIAENVAHYHHERVDGSGYPDGLKGDEIPLEARIMAVSDVYDALVSKRVYKEEFSFEKADRIILEGMGTQFDAQLKPIYEAARPKLEAYYASLQNSAG